MTSGVQNLIQITPSDMLQADVTIIAGVLVLLTISGVFESRFSPKLWKELRSVIAITPMFFTISAGLLLLGTVIPIDQTSLIQDSTFVMIGGLAYIAISVPVVMIISNRQT